MAEPSHPMIAPPAAPTRRQTIGPHLIVSSPAGVAIGSERVLGSPPPARMSPKKSRMYIVDSSSEEPVLDTAQ